MATTSTPAERETRALKSLTQSGEPKTAERVSATLERVLAIRRHADERCAFYAECGEHETAEAWSELAVEADYRAEKIAAEEWAWA